MTPLPFVTREWLRYLDLLDTHGEDLGGDDLALIACEDELQDQLAEFIAAQPAHNAPIPADGLWHTPEAERQTWRAA